MAGLAALEDRGSFLVKGRRTLHQLAHKEYGVVFSQCGLRTTSFEVEMNPDNTEDLDLCNKCHAFAELQRRREAAVERGDTVTQRVMSSADWLAANFAQVPLVILPFVRNDPDGSGIYPAVWNLMLAARAEGVGTTLTTVLHHFAADEVAELLGVPVEKGWRNAAAIPCGYPLGTWGVAGRPPVEDVVFIDDPDFFRHRDPVRAYRARRGDRPVAVIMNLVAPDGYNGAIRLLAGIYRDGTVSGVRVIAHRETPGLGDPIEADRSDWIHAFEGRSLADPLPRGWAVRRDGGDFDQFTGATITPRAVVEAVQRALEYHAAHADRLYAAAAVKGDGP